MPRAGYKPTPATVENLVKGAVRSWTDPEVRKRRMIAMFVARGMPRVPGLTDLQQSDYREYRKVGYTRAEAIKLAKDAT